MAALIGGMSGYFIHREIEQKGEQIRRETILNLESFSQNETDSPWPIPSNVQGYEIAPKVEGKKLIGRHKIWVIKDSKWPQEAPVSKEVSDE